MSGFDTSANDLHAGGATFPALAYNGAIQPVGTFSQAQPTPAPNSMFSKGRYAGTANVYYCLTGSGVGRAFFTTGSKTSGGVTITTTGACAPLGQSPTGFGARVDPPDFAGSDVALLTTEYATYATNRKPTLGEPFEFPAVAGPIVFPYKATDLPSVATTRMTLSRWSYCAISNGTISDWNDPAITADNGKSVTGGKSLPIKYVFRSDGSGTTANFTNHLATVCQSSSWSGKYASAPYESAGHSANWTFGGNSANWPGPGSAAHPNPNFIGAKGNPGVIAAIQSTVGATGYAEGAYAAAATHPSLLQTRLLNQSNAVADPVSRSAVAATFSTIHTTLGGAPDGTLPTTRPDCVYFINQSEFVNPTSSAAYPIGAVSYLMMYGRNNGGHLANLRKLVSYVESSASTTLISKLEYAPIPSSIQSTISKAATTGTPANPTSPCLQ